MGKKLYNCFGKKIKEEKLTDKKITADESFLNEEGYFDWPIDNGFDQNVIIAGNVHMASIELPKGKAFVRYGNNNGKLLADKGTPYEMLGLPYKKELKEYHEYILQKSTKFDRFGYIAPAFNSIGGVVQYYIKDGVKKLIDAGILIEDESWRK